jgi:hypothetical protein
VRTPALRALLRRRLNVARKAVKVFALSLVADLL